MVMHRHCIFATGTIIFHSLYFEKNMKIGFEIGSKNQIQNWIWIQNRIQNRIRKRIYFSVAYANFNMLN